MNIKHNADLSSCSPRAARVSQTIFGIVDTTETQNCIFNVRWLLRLTLTDDVLSSGSPGLSGSQNNEYRVLGKSLKIFAILNLSAITLKNDTNRFSNTNTQFVSTLKNISLFNIYFKANNIYFWF